MKRDLGALANRQHDLVVIGGGAFGCCAAWEAASRGLKVALVERGDFCAATSANHYKLVHGGVRYLQHLDLPRVRGSIQDRAALLRVAPHLVRPIPIVMPTYGHGLEGRQILRAGLLLYDLVALDRNRGIEDPSRRIPRGRLISREQCLKRFPELRREGLTGAGVFYDGQFHNPPRLALAFLRSAVDAGASVGNYLEATGFRVEDGRIAGVSVKDRVTGDGLEINANVVLNACGPWAARLLRGSLGVRFRREPRFSRDAAFAVRGRRLGDEALACRIDTQDPDALLSRKGRHVFLAPWRDYTLVGVWHKLHSGDPDEFDVAEDELQSFLDDVNVGYPGAGLALDDVSMVYAGLTLFGENRPDAKNLSFGKRSLLIDHATEHGIEGLVTLIGVRATTALGTAQKAVERILSKLGRRAPPSRTGWTPVHGATFESFESLLAVVHAEHDGKYPPEVLESLVHNYGSEYSRILDYADEAPAWAQPLDGSQTLGAQVVHAVREEMAVSLEDVVFRRTDLASGGHPGRRALEACAALMAAELGWDARRAQQEIENVEARFPRFGHRSA